MANSFTEDMKYTQARKQLTEYLRQGGIVNQAVLEAIEAVPRHIFMDPTLWDRAYEDTALPIECDQTISQPYIVAQMTSALCEKGRLSSVLEIGTGSGYQAAILSRLADIVYTIERVEALAIQARSRFEALGFSNIQVIYGDGYQGWIESAPYPAIIVTAAPERLPKRLLAQLIIGGRMVIPVGELGSQHLVLITRLENGFQHLFLEAVRFVPLLPGTR